MADDLDFKGFDESFDSGEDFTEQLGIGTEKGKKKAAFSGIDSGAMPPVEEMDWIVHFANLITILMFFFMMLYGFSTIAKNSSSYEKAMASIQKMMGGDKAQLEKINKNEMETEVASRMEDFIKDKNLAQFAKVETNAQRVKISLSNPILFDSGSAVLKIEAAPALKEIATLLKTLPNLIVVEGHTDNVPFVGKTYRSNFELSAARAFSVIRYFIEGEKIDPSRFTAFGYGEFTPLFPNDNDEHKAMNRRIEINIQR
ncbi:MAG: OmpA family protein [Elusimicrobiota bacterium]